MIMFNEKREFVKVGQEITAKTRSGNNALKYTHTDDEFLNQSNQFSNYRKPRDPNDIFKDQQLLYSIDPNMSLAFVIYMRAIDRKVILPDGTRMETITRGGGLKHEAIMRYIWFHTRNKKLFFDNLLIFVSVGSWRDLFDMLRLDLMYHEWDKRVLDWDRIFDILHFGLSSDHHYDLIAKYLPTIKPNKKCTTLRSQANNMIAKWIASKLEINYKEYRILKRDGNAHTWQQKISQQRFDALDFNEIHGRALAKLVGGNFLKNQQLIKKYKEWVEKQPLLKYTGFPHELFSKRIPGEAYKRVTIDKQFMSLVKKAKGNSKQNRLIVVRDTSGSMRATAKGTNMSSFNIAKAIALYFSYFLEGYFQDAWIEFNREAKLHKWVGKTPTERWLNCDASVVGNTDFLTVAHLFSYIKQQNVEEKDFPTGILCISDGEFDEAPNSFETNIVAFHNILKEGGFSEEYIKNFQIVLWDIRNQFYGNRKAAFETYESDTRNVFYFSGYSPSIIAFLTGTEYNERTPKNAKEVLMNALTQPIMQHLEF